MVPTAMVAGMDIIDFVHREVRIILPNHQVMTTAKTTKLRRDELYVGAGHNTHTQPASKWANPFIEDQHGTAEECMIYYVDYISRGVRDLLRRLHLQIEAESQCQ